MNSSKIVLIFCAFAAFSALTEAIDDRHKGVFENCAKKLGVDFADLNKYNKGELAQDEKWKCYAACVMKGLGLMKEDGTINKDNFSMAVPADKPNHDEIVAALRSCSETVTGTDECDLANKFNLCAKEKKLWGDL